jgi:hypothetical protein
MSKTIPKSCVLRRQGLGTKEVSEVQRGCLPRGETALSKGLLADRHGPSQGEARFSKTALQEKRDMLTQSG